MRINALGAACLATAGMLMIGWPSAGWAQRVSTWKMGTFSTAADVGGRGYLNEPTAQEKGKLEEYRDLRSGLVLQQLLLKYTPADSFGTYKLTARNVLRRDQSVLLQASRPGMYDFRAGLDGITHTFSTTARTLATSPYGGVWKLPVPRPDSNAWLAAPYLAPVRSQWDPIRLSLALTPSPSWDTKVEYTRIAKYGDRPLSMTFGATTGPQEEFLEPIDHTVNDFRLAQSYANKRFQLMASYDFSMFQNAVKSVLVDSPLNYADTPTNGAAAGRVALPPDNSARTAVVTAAANLPAHTRVSATASNSWWKQNDAFVAQTSNSLLAGRPALARSRGSLEGEAKTSTLSASVTSRPWPKVTLSAKLRSFDFSNQTPAFAIDSIAISDRSVAAGVEAETHPYTKTNGELGANYRLARFFTASAGYATEKWTRPWEEANVKTTNEHTARVSVDYNGVDWLSFKASYKKGVKRGGAYSTDENPDFRRFYLADRDREQINFLAQLMPSDSFTVGLTWQVGHDAFPNSIYGTQSDNNTMTGADVDWIASARLSFSAGYAKETYHNRINMQYRTGAVGSATINNPTYRWVNRNVDGNTTVYASFNATLIPEKLSAGGSVSLADAHFTVFNANPTTPTGGTAAQNLSATAVDFPEVSQKTQPMTLFFRYRYAADWALTLQYQGETYNQNDYRSLPPSYTGLGGDLPTSIGNFKFFGNNYRNYNANWMTMFITWKPSALPFTRGRSTI